MGKRALFSMLVMPDRRQPVGLMRRLFGNSAGTSSEMQGGEVRHHDAPNSKMGDVRPASGAEDSVGNGKANSCDRV